MTEEDLLKVTQIAAECKMSGRYFKAVIIPHEGDFHVLTEGYERHRDVFTTNEAACSWAAAYFMKASVLPPKEVLLQQREQDLLDN